MVCLETCFPQDLLSICVFGPGKASGIFVEFGRVYHWMETPSRIACIV